MFRKRIAGVVIAITALTTLSGAQSAQAQNTPATSTPATSAAGHEASIKFLLSTINSTPPTATDLSCLTKAISPAELDGLFAMVGKSGGTLDAKVLSPVMKKVYDCKPSALMVEVKNRFLNSASLTPKQQNCVAEAILETVAADMALIDGIVLDSSLKSLKPELKARLVQALQPKLKKCVPSKPARTKITSALTA